MVGLFYKAVPVLADEDKIGGSAIHSLLGTVPRGKDVTAIETFGMSNVGRRRVSGTRFTPREAFDPHFDPIYG